MIKTVVFDLDDTLFPEHQYVSSGFQAVGSWLNVNLSVTGFCEISDRLFKEGKRGNIFNLALERLGIPYDTDLILELLQIYRNHKPRLSLCEDARWAIYYFKLNKQIGIITDGFLTPQRNKVEALGITELFDAIIYSDEYGRENWKPSQVPYLKLMDQLTQQGSECVYIADNPCKDFITAKALGWTTIRICREGGEYSRMVPEANYEAHHKITSLFELRELIRN